MPLVSVVIPAYNESGRLPLTLDRILAYFENQQMLSLVEVLVVDDGSRDNTAEIVNGYAKKAGKVGLVKNPGNRGKGYAVRNGMLHATGEWVLFTDADLSAPIEELPKLMDAIRREDASVAIGSRALDRSLVEVHQNPGREIAGRTFNLLLRLMLDLRYCDTQCGFKLFRRDVAKEVFSRQKLDGFSFDVEDLVIAHRLGFKTVEVPVIWRNVEGSKVTLLRGLQSFSDLLRIRWGLTLGRYDK